MVCGLNVTVVPDGTPEADNVMLLLNPLLTVVVTVDVPADPWVRFRVAGEAAIEKFPTAEATPM